MKIRHYLLLLFIFVINGAILSQSTETPQNLRVGSTGFASWDAPDSQNTFVYRIWIDNELIDDITDTEYQINTDSFNDNESHSFAVASVHENETSDIISKTFTYYSCEHFPSAANIKFEYDNNNNVVLKWSNSDEIIHVNDVITHPKSGYNNYDISSLHSGLTQYGFNADKDAGHKIMDKINIKYDVERDLFGIRFYIYEGATSISTITNAYLSIYDGDPENGGQLVTGSQDVNCYTPSGYNETRIFRTGDNDFYDVNHPIFFADAYLPKEITIPEDKTYWFVVSFTGSLKDKDVHIIPRTILNETTTGEARIYSEETGWQAMKDHSTQTQQGVAYDLIGYVGGALIPIEFCDIYRNGELIHRESENCDNFSFTDENTPDGIKEYGIQNIYNEGDGIAKSCIETIETFRSFPPTKGIFIEATTTYSDLKAIRIDWWDEDMIDMPLDLYITKDIKTFYEIYRRHEYEDNFTLISCNEKEYDAETQVFMDIIPEEDFSGTYYYKIRTYNLYDSGYSISNFSEIISLNLDNNIEKTKENQEVLFKTFPNPAVNNIHIIMNDFRFAEIVDMFGRKQIESHENIINIEHLPSGIYIIKATDNNDIIIVRKIVKK